ncbi:MAG TPA: hypothetical protein VK721_05005 [Solirubrobacteraceae bacterium]|jgi:hypothetical protein|nr:hypothetical protein [Solirubrobacteraceae bacterium]
MASLRAVDVPEPAREGMRGFALLDEREIDAIVDSLDQSEGILSPKMMEERVRAAAPSLEDSTGFTIGLLTLVAQAEDVPTAAVAGAVGGSRDLGDLGEAERERFASGLERLLSIPCVRLSAKAWDLTTEYEHVFLTARVLTDVRPVFKGDGGDDEATPVAAVIVDTLKLDYYGPGGDVRSFHVALDRDDLETLESAIKRGISKTDKMRDFLAQASLPSWNADDD